MDGGSLWRVAGCFGLRVLGVCDRVRLLLVVMSGHADVSTNSFTYCGSATFGNPTHYRDRFL